MNKYQLYTLGGALLTATSLAGTASAGTFGVYKGSVFSTGSITISNKAFSTTATTANGVTIQAGTANTGAKIALAFTNSYDNSFNLNLTIPVTGATFQSKPALGFMVRQSTGTYAATTYGSASGEFITTPSVSALASTLFVQNLQLTATATIGGGLAASLGGVVLSGVTFTNASGLATSGGTIALQASVASQTNSSLVYETAASSTVVSSAAPLAVSASSSSATVKVGTAPSQFTTFSGSNSLSLTLATVNITSTGAVGTDLSIALDADGTTAGYNASSASVNVTVSSAALSDAAVTKLIVTAHDKNQAIAGVSQFTPGVFTAGTVTFTLTAGSNTYDSSFNVILAYDGSTAISAVSTAGTVSAVLASGGSSVVSPGSGTGATATISRGGLSAEVSWANAGTGSGFTSYVRIHNKGTAASTATIVVTKDVSDGSTTAISTLGTVTTSSIAAGGTIQVGVPAIESSLGINSSTAGGSYTLKVTGGFPGYVQHLSYNGSSLFDLSGFRNGSDGTNSAP